MVYTIITVRRRFIIGKKLESVSRSACLERFARLLCTQRQIVSGTEAPRGPTRPRVTTRAHPSPDRADAVPRETTIF